MHKLKLMRIDYSIIWKYKDHIMAILISRKLFYYSIVFYYLSILYTIYSTMYKIILFALSIFLCILSVTINLKCTFLSYNSSITIIARPDNYHKSKTQYVVGNITNSQCNFNVSSCLPKRCDALHILRDVCALLTYFLSPIFIE